MSAILLRKLILLVSILYLVSTTYYHVVTTFFPGPYAVEEDGKLLFIVRGIMNLVISFAAPVIGLWAAHSLKPIKYISDGMMIFILKAVGVLVGISVLTFMFESAWIGLPNLPNLPKPSLMPLLEYFNWGFYGLVEVLIILFAIRQLTNKNKNLALSAETQKQEASVGEADPGT